MTYVINRNVNFKVIKKDLTISNTINPNSLKESLGSTKSNEFLNLNSFSINNQPVLATATQLNYLQTTPGIGNKIKALVLDSNRDIININTISCNTIIINGNTITGNSDLYGSISNDTNNSYLTNIISGIGQENKALILDSNLNIQNINKLSTNYLIYKNTYINSYSNKKIFTEDLNNDTITNKLIIDKYINYNNNSNLYQSNSYLANLTLLDIAWSSELELFVAICRSPNGYDYSKIYTSTNGYQWTTISHPHQQNHCGTIIWSKNYKLFIVTLESISAILVSSNGINWVPINLAHSYTYIYEANNYLILLGGTNQIAISQDGYNWNYNNFNLNSNVLSSICWANSLNLYILTATSGSNNNKIYISHDCINWIDIKMNYFTNISQGFQLVAWSEELNILVASGTNAIFYSTNGISWSPILPIDNGIPIFTDLEWNSEMQAFVALDNSNSHLYISYNGITWLRYNNTSYTYSKLAWCNKYGMYVLLRSDRIGNMIIYKKKSNLLNNNVLKINHSTNAVGINCINPQTALDINSNNGKCLKLLSANSYSYEYNQNTYACDFDIVNGQLNITPYRINPNTPLSSYIYTNYLTYGLKLNNILIKTSANEFNYITNIIPGVATINKTLLMDSNSDISNINALTCNSLIINNGEVTSGSFNTNPFLQNNIIGVANSEKVLITDSSINISSINLINSKICQFNNYNKIFSNTQTTSNININQLQYSNIKKINNLSLNNNAKWNIKTLNTQTYYDICWCPELNIFVAIGSGIISVSKDGINYTNSVLPANGWTYQSITWSPELSLFVVICVNSSTNNNIMTSKDGYNWTVQFNPSSDMSLIQVIWIAELRAFIAISTTGSTTRSIISYDGEFWMNSNLSISYSWNKIVWVAHLNTLICTNSGSTFIAKSTDGFNWTYTNINTNPSSFTGFNYLTYSKELNIIVTGSGWQNLYSFDGINWGYIYNGDYLGTSNIYWISDLKIFISIYPDRFIYSTDGINFTNRFASLSGNNNNGWNSLAWSPSLNILVAVANYGTYRLLYSDLINTKYSRSTLYSHKSHMYLNKSNGNLGLGTSTPNYQLELSTDTAKKPSTTTWTIVSDIRLKENIELANLDTCYNILQNLKLKKYKWKNSITNYNNIKDKHKLGWIADEVENYFPKSILIKNTNNLNDCKNLDIDQIVSIMYGTTQKIINNYDKLDFDINLIKNKLNNIKLFINNLTN